MCREVRVVGLRGDWDKDRFGDDDDDFNQDDHDGDDCDADLTSAAMDSLMADDSYPSNDNE